MKKNYIGILGSLIASTIGSVFLYFNLVSPFIIINNTLCYSVHILLGGIRFHNVISSIYLDIFLLFLLNIIAGYIWEKVEEIKQLISISMFSVVILIINVFLFHFSSILFPGIFIIIIIWLTYAISIVWINSKTSILLSTEIDKLLAKYKVKRLKYDYSGMGLHKTSWLKELSAKDALPGTKIETLAQLGHTFERERSFLQTLIKNLNQPILVCDEESRILLLSPEVEKVFHNIKFVGQNITRFLSNFFPDLEEKFNETFTTIPLQKNITHCHSYFGNKFYQITIIPVSDKDDSFNGSICILNDITEMHRRANTDGLTGIWNHKHFKEQLEEELKKAKRHKAKYPLALILIDIDFFKSINDTYGHLVGDEVIKEIANLLNKEARTIDLVARYGGEEFVALLPMTPPEGAKIFAERVRTKISQLQINISDSQKLPQITCSFGITVYKDEKEIKELIEKADKALYKSKNEGRNCINIRI